MSWRSERTQRILLAWEAIKACTTASLHKQDRNLEEGLSLAAALALVTFLGDPSGPTSPFPGLSATWQGLDTLLKSIKTQ